MNKCFLLAGMLALAAGPACADPAGREHPENETLARPAIRVSVGVANADIVGADNRALQGAVDYVAALGGGTVEIGPGQYLMRDSLHLRSRVTLRGAGEKTILKKDKSVYSRLAADGDFGEEAITVANPEGFEVGRGVYVGSKRMRGFHGICATLLNRNDNYFTLSRPLNADCMMGDEAFAATVYPVLSAYNAQDVRVENLTIDGNRQQNECSIDGCRGAGIFLYRSDNALIQSCTVRDYSGDGISFQQSNDVQVRRCTVERCGGLGLHPGSGSQRPVVADCRSTGNGGDGFYFCWRVRGAVVEGNTILSNGGYGMSIGHKDSDNLVRKNVISGNAKGGVFWRNEAQPMAAHHITFSGNTVEDNGGWGLFVDGETQGTVIRDNTIRDSGSGRQKVGIRIGPRAGELRLENNRVEAAKAILDERQGRKGQP